MTSHKYGLTMGSCSVCGALLSGGRWLSPADGSAVSDDCDVARSQICPKPIYTKPTEALEQKLARAREASGKLGAATDAMTARLAEAESAIRDLRMGVCASVVDDDGTSAVVVGFAKLDGEWSIYCRRKDGDGQDARVTKASREMRVRAVRALPALVEALVAEAERQIELATALSRDLEEFVSHFNRART